MILTPDGLAPEINRTATAQGDSCPRDPYHYQRGEAGYFHDSQLGEVPNDFELSTVYGYTPVNEGWTQTNQGLIPGGIFAGHPLNLPANLGDSGAPLLTPTEEESLYRKRTFAIQAITAAAVVASALFAIRRSLKDDKKRAR